MGNKKNITKAIIISAIIIAAIAVLILLLPLDKKNKEIKTYGEKIYNLSLTDSRVRYMLDNPDDYSDEIFDQLSRTLRLYKNKDVQETLINFCYNYAFHKNDYYTMSYTDEELNGEDIPALYMKDPRWAYETIGANYIIEDGCMAVSLTMAYLHINHAEDIDPVIISRIAEDQGAVTIDGGIASHYVQSVCEEIGLTAVEYNYDADDGGSGEADISIIQEILNSGHTVLAGMVGETFGGHALIIRSCDDNGTIYINDPASEENTEKAWQLDDLIPEIYYLWDLS